MPEADVKTTLTIETAGEPGALRQAADDITALGTAAAAVAPSLQTLATTLEALKTASTGGLGPLLSELDQLLVKARETAAALQQITGAGGGGAA
jgi:hypothetical protein